MGIIKISKMEAAPVVATPVADAPREEGGDRGFGDRRGGRGGDRGDRGRGGRGGREVQVAPVRTNGLPAPSLVVLLSKASSATLRRSTLTLSQLRKPLLLTSSSRRLRVLSMTRS